MMIFEELNTRTRNYMIEEFRTEQINPAPYRPRVLPLEGEAAFVGLMEEHVPSVELGKAEHSSPFHCRLT